MNKRTWRWAGTILWAIVLALMIPITAPACMTPDDRGIEKYNGAWEPTDDTVFAVAISLGDAQVSIYDFGTPDNTLELLSDDPFTNIYFTEIKNNGDSTWYADTTAGGQSLLLGEDAQFGISFASKKGTSYEYLLHGDSGPYKLVDPKTHTALVMHDAATVETPLPGAFLLLGSGLFGLTVTRRRSRKA